MWNKKYNLFFLIILKFLSLSINSKIIIPLKIRDNANKELNYIESLLQNQLYAEIKLGTPKQKIYMSISTETESFSIESRLINDKFYFHNDSSTHINTEKKLSFYHERYKSGNIFIDTFYLQKYFDINKIEAFKNISFNYIYELSEEFTHNEKVYYIDKNKNLISGVIGLQIPKSYSSSTTFLNSLNYIGAINSNIWSLVFNNKKDYQSYLILGENLFNNNYTIDDSKKAKAYTSGIDSYWNFVFSDIKTGNTKLNQERLAEYAPQLGVIFGTNEYRDYINNNFFVNLLKENICIQNKISVNSKLYTYYECDKNINTNNFEPLIFTHQEFSYNFTLDKNDLFVDFDGKKYFLCIFLENDMDTKNHWVFGIPFIKKYNFVFDEKYNLISFYDSEFEIKEEGRKISWIVWILIIILILITSLLGLYLLYKIIFRPKKINANELEDSFNIMNQNNKKSDVDLDTFYNSKYNKLGE